MPDVQLMVHYLARKFPIAISPGFKDGVEQMIREPQWSERELRFYFRVVDADYRVSPAVLADATGFNWLTAQALYCDVYPLPAHFEDSLIAYNRGSYDCTHAAFALAWVKEKGCHLSSPDSYLWIQSGIESRLVEVIEERGADTDVGIEAMAMLLQLGRHDKIAFEWIERLIEIQSADGYWSEKPSSSVANDHTTALALWTLLEYSYPNAPKMPWVKKQNESH